MDTKPELADKWAQNTSEMVLFDVFQCEMRSKRRFSGRFRAVQELQGVDVAVEKGMMDMGIVEFAPGNYLDEMRAWHFKHHVAYCVAPVVSNRSSKTG